ncbi:BatD family protein [Alteromonas sp. McT4-15]|uniref:BatD family protein n=1 Tax=Alteromonas sp. McT4-15 TaxID=2881256 RepID=UPI001CF8AEE0|nr:BatD family protein [Alteromonas sp. McT4-15]MCB4435928.1 BatD family protein [Alteromonas sp. McT4-15]
MRVLSLSTYLILFFAVFGNSSYADVNAVEATIDRNPVMLDEAIRLTITADGSVERDAFDSSPLLKDFVVGRTSVSSQTSIVNFDTKRTTVWTTTLFPRKEGVFTIPALTIEGKRTKPIEVQVIPVQEQSGVARDYFVTTDIDLTEAYLNQQLLYTVKLYLSSNIERGSLQAPEMQNAEITQLGEDKQYTDIVNGRRYQIIERQFAVVPQASGEFILRGPIFTGEVMAANTNQRFGFFNRTQQINRVGPDITVNIKPIPSDIDYPWLPSEMVRVDEEWPQGDVFVAGEPVTRIVTLTALGVVEEQLPDIPEFYPPNFKLYPDQSNTTTVERDQNLISQRQTSLAIIPTEAGSFVLPEITIPWFNTLTEQTEYATIPARTITVEAANTNSTALPQVPDTSSNKNATENPTLQTDTSAPLTGEEKLNNQTAHIEESGQNNSVYFYLMLVIAVLWVLTLIAWIVTYRKLKHASAAPINPASYRTNTFQHGDEKSAYDHLISVAKQGKVRELDSALQQWLATLNDGKSQRAMPGDIAESAPLKSHMERIHKLRFSSSAKNNNNEHKELSENLKSLVQNIKDTRTAWLKRTKKATNTLSNLYPAS